LYKAHFGFTEKPFSIAPNPRYLYMSERHREALAHLLYGMQGEGGFVLLTGEVGTGKTTICRCMLSQIPENTEIAFIVNPKLSATELLATVCDELGINYDKRTKSIKKLTDFINGHLLAAHAEGRHTVLIIDEAQNLEASVLEQLRLLTNLETDQKKLLQIILLGQPELAEKLEKKELRQLSQRITARYHLTPLNKTEVEAYLQHRLAVAGSSDNNIFPASTISRLFRESSGIPRLINIMADRALLGAYAQNTKTVSKPILKQAVREVIGEKHAKPSRVVPWSFATVLLLALAIFLSTSLWQPQNGDNATAAIVKPLQPAMTEAVTAPIVKTTSEIIVAPEPVIEPIPTVKNRDAAFISIFSAWGIEYRPELHGAACEFALSQQLSCLRQRGDIASMRNLDRPAVLILSDESGAEAFTPLLNIAGTKAIIGMGNKYATVERNLSELALQSHNDFTILWRTPNGYSGPVRPGHRGEIVQILGEKSAQAQNQQWIGTARLYYDVGLKEQVKSFQRAEGLTPDGVAGPITWIRMNSLTEANIPTLKTELLSDSKEAS